MVGWAKGERTVHYLVGNGRLESIEAANFGALADSPPGQFVTGPADQA